MLREGCNGTGPIIRGLHFQAVRGCDWVKAGLPPRWLADDPDVDLLHVIEVIQHLDEPLALEARVAGLGHWLRSCSAAEELKVARRAVEWARRTDMSASCRARWRDAGRPRNSPAWIAALNRAKLERLGDRARA